MKKYQVLLNLGFGIAVITIMLIFSAIACNEYYELGYNAQKEKKIEYVFIYPTSTPIVDNDVTPDNPELTLEPSENNDIKIIIPTPEVTPELTEEPVEWITYKITAYCACEECSKGYGNHGCQSNILVDNYSVAADLSVLPFGTIIEIEGLGERRVEDCGSSVKGNMIDLYLGDATHHQDTVNWGIRYLKVKVVK